MAGTAAKTIRIQRKRTKGWKMPPNTVYVGRPTKWGNPYTPDSTHLSDLDDCVQAYRSHFWKQNGKWKFDAGNNDVEELRGKNLACWCPLNKPCHADVLLEIANLGMKKGKPMSEIKVVPQPRWFVKDVSEKFGSPWFHVVGPQGCVTQSADREWAEKTVATFNESEKRYTQESPAPEPIEQAAPPRPPSRRPIVCGLCRKLGYATCECGANEEAEYRSAPPKSCEKDCPSAEICERRCGRK